MANKEDKNQEKKKLGFFGRILRRKKLIIFLIVVVLGFFVWRHFIKKNGKEFEETEVKKGTVHEELILTGTVNADEYAQLSFPTSGKISQVYVSEGDEVKKGQALTKLDTTVLNSAFEQAKATLRAAEANVEEVHDQVKDNDSDESYDEKNTRTAAEATKDKAYDSYVAAEYNLRNATLVSPFAGIVTYLAHPFSQVNVMSTETQVEVINPETIYFDVSADQTEVTQLSMGQKVLVVLDSFPDKEFEGKVTFISYTPKAGEVGSVYKAKVSLPVASENLGNFRIGMTGDAKFILSEKSDVLYVPPDFVNTDTKGSYVRKDKENGKVYVEVGIESEERVEISGDIKEGDVVFD